MEGMTDTADDLATFIADAPTPYHAVAQAAGRLRDAGYSEISDLTDWRATGGHFFVRDGTLIAWSIPEGRTASTPVRVFAAHTDSPTLKIKPRPDTGVAGWRQIAVEVYGGALWNSWLDRDLGVAGRLVSYAGDTTLVHIDRPLLRIPQLAIHLDRQVNNGLVLDPDRHLTPVWGLGDPAPGEFLEFLSAEAGVDSADVAAHDLVVCDVNPPARIGRERELLAAPRLDNLASVYAGVNALIQAAASSDEVLPVLACFDHEEIGSATATGAAGPLLDLVLTSLAEAPDERRTWAATARCLSVDVTHAAHPNYLDRHDPDHRAVPNGGPALKVNANQHYATDAPGAAAWYRACRTADVPTQVFVSRNSMPCGSTVGPLIATRLGIRTIDVGIPVLSMHSSRELCGADDPAHLIAAAAAFLTDTE